MDSGMDVWRIVAAAAVVLSALNVFPQLVKTWRTKRAGDLSHKMLVVIMSGNVLWVFHGAHVDDPAIVIANVMLFSQTLVLMAMKVRYDLREGGCDTEQPQGGGLG